MMLYTKTLFLVIQTKIAINHTQKELVRFRHQETFTRI